MMTCNATGVCRNPLGACAKKCAMTRKPQTKMRELPMHDAEGLSLQARMVWLHLRDEGGWWSAKELARDLMPGDAYAPSAVAPCLGTLAERGHVVQRAASREQALPGKRVLVYGVTAKCRAPVGCSLEPGK